MLCPAPWTRLAASSRDHFQFPEHLIFDLSVQLPLELPGRVCTPVVESPRGARTYQGFTCPKSLQEPLLQPILGLIRAEPCISFPSLLLTGLN